MKINLSYKIVFLCVLCSNFLNSQISPPGLGVGNTAGWFAFGLRQEFDTLKEWQSMTYVGMGRKSNPDTYDPLFKSAILVLTQEFYHKFDKNWQYSAAFSYRRQDEYFKTAPYNYESPNYKQEYRVYSRFSYIYKTRLIKFVPTIRQEFRKYYSPTFTNINEDFQFRTRFRLQLTVNLDKNKVHKISLGSEQLFSISKNYSPNAWTDFNYRESRFTFYYSFSPQKLPLIYSVGYMYNRVGIKQTYSVNYFAVDVIWENPFKLKQRKKENITENFE